MLPLLLLGLFCAICGSIARYDRSQHLLASPEAIDKPPERNLEDVAINVKVTSVVTYAGDTLVCQLSLPLEQEVFTPPLTNGKRYNLIFSGKCWLKMYDWYGLDACYYTDGKGNYRYRHKALRLNDRVIDAQPTAEDRAEHRYTFPYDSHGGRLSVMLEMPSGLRRAHVSPNSTLQVAVVELAPKKDPLESIFDHQQRAAERHAAEEHKKQAALQKRALELATLAHLESNFLDPQYQQRYAETYQAQVLRTEKSAWLDEYRKVVSDEHLSRLLAQEHPHVMPFLEARLEIARIAQRLAVKPAPEPPATETKRKPYLTREAWEARIERYRQRQLDRMRVNADDRIAKMLEKVESARRLRERAEELALDEDQIERLEQELMGELQDDDDEATGGFKQL